MSRSCHSATFSRPTIAVPADEPREAADPLGDDRVALVGHRGGALLAGSERLLDLAHFRAREVSDLEREAIERRREHGEGGEDLRVAIALEDLRRAGGRVESKRLARDPLHLRCRGRIRPHRTRELPDAHAGERVVEPSAVALELECPAQELEPEGRRLGVHPVGTADRDRAAMFRGARIDRVHSPIDACADQLAGGLDGERKRRVDDVRRGQAVVKPPSVRAEIRRHRVDEGGDVVVGHALELGDAVRAGNSRSLADGARTRRRDRADVGPRVEHRELHGQPGLELRLLRPDPGHLRSGVAGNHRCDSSRRPCGRLL